MLLGDELLLFLVDLVVRFPVLCSLDEVVRRERREPFGQPLVAIATPADFVSPPLVSHFVRADRRDERFGSAKFHDAQDALIGKTQGRQIHECWPGLPEVELRLLGDGYP